MKLKLLFLLFGALCGWSAYLQLNDPDPEVWVTLYGYLAVVSLLGAAGRPHRIAILLGLAVCGYLAWKAWPGAMEFIRDEDIGFSETMSDEQPYVEEFREFGGMAISVLVLLPMLFSKRTKK